MDPSLPSVAGRILCDPPRKRYGTYWQGSETFTYGGQPVSNLIRQPGDEGVYLFQNLGFVRLKDIVIRVWNANDMRGRNSGFKGLA